MSVYLVENGYGIRGIAPPDLKDHPEFALAFWQWVTVLGLRAKDRELAQGLDKDGKPLRPITAATRKHRRSAMTPGGKGDPSAPPLMPGRALSRTRSLLTGRAYPDHAEFWWRFDAWTGDSWARVLDIQAEHGRDVFGLSTMAQKRVQAQAWQLWDRLKRGQSIPPMPLPAVALGGGMAPSTRPRGGMTMAELEAHYRAPARAIPGRPAANVLLHHVFGEPGTTGKVAGGAVVPRPPRPKPITVKRVAMAPKPKPEPPKPPPRPPTFEESLAARLKSLPPGNDLAERKARRYAIAELIEAHAGPGPEGIFHGMTDKEQFRSLSYRGWNLHFAGPADYFAAVTNEIENFERRGVTFPKRLAKATTDIYFTKQENNKDAHWRKKYGMPETAKSVATGGDGTIVIYQGKPAGVSTLAHESGHNLATKLYGSTDPTVGYNDYDKLLSATKEPPVSDYARSSPAEDFAEAVMFYIEEYDTMKAKYPERFRIIHKIMTESSYGG